MLPRARGPALLPLLGCLVIAACGPAPSSSASPAAQASGSPGPGASPGPPGGGTPAASQTAPPSCRLPVASGDAPVDGRTADGTAGHGGFVRLPGGTFTADPASLGTYDRAISRWLPVFRAWVSPDGTKYAWSEYRSAAGPATGIVHVVDAASGADHPVTVPAPSYVVSYEREGVYVTRVVPNSDAPSQGLALVDPAAGTTRQVAADGSWSTIGAGFAFGQDLDPALPLPAGAGPAAANRVRRLDLRTGAIGNVGSFPGAYAQVLGVYGSAPLIAVTNGATYTISVGTGTTVFSGPTADANPRAPVVV